MLNISEDDLIRAPEEHIFAGDYGENYHLVKIGEINLITSRMRPICGADPINMDKKTNRILPHRVCRKCRELLK